MAFSPNLSRVSYEPDFIANLFNRMARKYTHVPDICSLGLTQLWRKKAIALLDLKPGEAICDLMSGTGESFRDILEKIGSGGSIYAVDLSHEMSHLAKARAEALHAENIHVLEGDARSTALSSESMNAIFSAYGVKTLSPDFYADLALEAKRILKAGGRAVFVEASLPENRAQRVACQSYIKTIFFILKSVIGKRADDFAMFSDYLARFKNCKELRNAFQEAGFQVAYIRLPADGATAIVAQKPACASVPKGRHHLNERLQAMSAAP